MPSATVFLLLDASSQRERMITYSPQSTLEERNWKQRMHVSLSVCRHVMYIQAIDPQSATYYRFDMTFCDVIAGADCRARTHAPLYLI